MMWLPKSDESVGGDPNACRFNLPLAVSIDLAIGFLGGLVGQGGSFILIPLRAQLGSVLSHRTSPRWLRTTLAVVIALAAAGMIVDVIGGGMVRH